MNGGVCREQKGVKVRIELGPRDAHKSQACLAISLTPGEVAKKVTYQVLVGSACLLDSGLDGAQHHTSAVSGICTQLWVSVEACNLVKRM